MTDKSCEWLGDESDNERSEDEMPTKFDNEFIDDSSESEFTDDSSESEFTDDSSESEFTDDSSESEILTDSDSEEDEPVDGEGPILRHRSKVVTENKKTPYDEFKSAFDEWSDGEGEERDLF